MAQEALGVVTKDLIKREIDKVQEEHLPVLYRIVRALEEPAGSAAATMDWPSFIAETYGSLADDPIERGEQGSFEVREPLG